MHPEPKRLLKEAVLKCLPILQPLVGKHVAPHLVWKQKEEGRWDGDWENKPDLGQVFKEAHEQIQREGQSFGLSFLTHHPQYNGHVGIPQFGSMNFGHFINQVVRWGIGHLWRQHETFNLDGGTVDSLVNEFELFVDSPTVSLIFRAQLLNFKMPIDSIHLPAGLEIRRMTPKEISDFYGGSMEKLAMSGPRHFNMDEFCIEGETEFPKVFGSSEIDEVSQKERVKDSLDKTILCLRTFKAGRVGYDSVSFYSKSFCPLPLSTIGYGDRYVPFGRYCLTVEEIENLAEHAGVMFCVSEPSMEMACSRLADSENRTKPQDQLVDAVIGMEALLLAGLRTEDRRGELRFRFSLNYSTLFSGFQERYHALNVAKKLYDLRSMIVHGGRLGDKVFRLGDEDLKLPDIANRASEALRYLVLHFIPRVREAPYRRPEFWEQSYFGSLGTTQLEKGIEPE